MAMNPLLIYRGDTFSKKFLIGTKDPLTGEVTGVDLTSFGSEWLSQLRRLEDDTEVVSFSVDTSEADTGYITLSLTSEDTIALPQKGVWDLQVTDSTASPFIVRTFVKGTFELIKDVTRP